VIYITYVSLFAFQGGWNNGDHHANKVVTEVYTDSVETVVEVRIKIVYRNLKKQLILVTQIYRESNK
jgi:DMSO/TMAO reductase YedYZ molybdopterin-dependent catalytic subunit